MCALRKALAAEDYLFQRKKNSPTAATAAKMIIQSGTAKLNATAIWILISEI
jgi:hypothetical protein